MDKSTSNFEKNREKIVPGHIEDGGDDELGLQRACRRLRTELEANFSLSQPALYMWLEDTPSDNQWTHLGALTPIHTPRP